MPWRAGRRNTPTSGRSRTEDADAIGYFVNTVPVRARLQPRLAFGELLTQVRRTVMGALAHADYPLARMVFLPRESRPQALAESVKQGWTNCVELGSNCAHAGEPAQRPGAKCPANVRRSQNPA